MGWHSGFVLLRWAFIAAWKSTTRHWVWSFLPALVAGAAGAAFFRALERWFKMTQAQAVAASGVLAAVLAWLLTFLVMAVSYFVRFMRDRSPLEVGVPRRSGNHLVVPVTSHGLRALRVSADLEIPGVWFSGLFGSDLAVWDGDGAPEVDFRHGDTREIHLVLLTEAGAAVRREVPYWSKGEVRAAQCSDWTPTGDPLRDLMQMCAQNIEIGVTFFTSGNRFRGAFSRAFYLRGLDLVAADNDDLPLRHTPAPA